MRRLPTATLSAPLSSGRLTHVISAPAFLATKLEAFKGRGRGDYLFSRDLSDITSVVDGRGSLLDELTRASPALRQGVSLAVGHLLATRGFLDSLPGHLPADAAIQ